MQRYKEPLDFAESPYQGVRHCKSPILAAERPLLTSTISAELLGAQWVSPQFTNETSISLEVENKKRRAACTKTKTQRKSKQLVEAKENNLFPSLNFSSHTNETFQHPNESDEPTKDDVAVRRSKQKKTSGILNVTAVNRQIHNIKSNKNNFLFSLGSPKPSVVLGKVLVPETPEDQMGKRSILDRRLKKL